ncbi:MAG: radical SAM family heme chaperone HemW [Prevotella sp.]|nr:radical SAM family heme chaperone HemW [Prevotella sp.]
MTGLYIHIPFCKSRCIYCAFFSSTDLAMREKYVEALGREMLMRPARDDTVATVYLGGGTPSQLTPAMLHKLFLYINKVYKLEKDAEITLECNPDDISPEMADAIASLPVNRVSMGVQTFSDQRLRFLRRRHSSSQIPLAVERLRRAGINNISIDLMFGFPHQTLHDWENDARQAVGLNVEHISAYALTYEEGTPLYRMREEGRLANTCDDDTQRLMYERLIDLLEEAGFEHYEISNFAKKTDTPYPTFRSRHNSSYWNGTPYIGIGAAAHSYDRVTRQWNVSDIGQYIQAVMNNERPIEETELLDDATRYNDLITTALRTREGISMTELKHTFPDFFFDYLTANAAKGIQRHLLEVTDGRLHLTRQGLFVSDDVMSDLVYVEP